MNAVNSNQYDEFSDDEISGFANNTTKFHTTKLLTTKFLATKFPLSDAKHVNVVIAQLIRLMTAVAFVISEFFYHYDSYFYELYKNSCKRIILKNTINQKRHRF